MIAGAFNLRELGDFRKIKLTWGFCGVDFFLLKGKNFLPYQN